MRASYPALRRASVASAEREPEWQYATTSWASPTSERISSAGFGSPSGPNSSSTCSRLAHGLELDGALRELALPAGDATDEDRDVAVARELGQLQRRHRADAVAAVDEHEPLRARDPVAAEPQRDLLRELRERLGLRERRRRAEHERSRSRDVAAHVRVRAAHVADDEIALTEVLG